MKTALIVVLLAVAVLTAGGFIAGPRVLERLQAIRSQAEIKEVRTAEVRRDELVETVSAPGELEPHTKVEISAQVSARIEQLPYEEGDEVSQGDLIVKLDDRDLRAALEGANARRDGELARLEAEKARLAGLTSAHEFATRELERKQSLHASGDIADKDLDLALERTEDMLSQIAVARHTIATIESSLAGAEADISRTEEGLAKTVILAPMDGVITALNAEVGEVVMIGTMNNPGTVIMTIADLDRMQVNAQVSESDIAVVDEGQPCRVHLIAYRDQVFSGTVTHISLQRRVAQDGSGFFETEVEIDLQGRRLRSGLTSNVDIEIGRHEGLVIEDQAIRDVPIDDLPEDVRRGNPLVDLDRRTTQAVYRSIDGKAVVAPVATGPSDLTRTLILDGLEEGDRVIVGPFKVLDTLAPDDAILDLSTAPKPGDEGADAPKASEEDAEAPEPDDEGAEAPNLDEADDGESG